LLTQKPFAKAGVSLVAPHGQPGANPCVHVVGPKRPQRRLNRERPVLIGGGVEAFGDVLLFALGCLGSLGGFERLAGHFIGKPLL
jgi:hypothetical protein